MLNSIRGCLGSMGSPTERRVMAARDRRKTFRPRSLFSAGAAKVVNRIQNFVFLETLGVGHETRRQFPGHNGKQLEQMAGKHVAQRPSVRCKVWIFSDQARLAREWKAPRSDPRRVQTACRRSSSITLHGHETALPRSWLSAAVIGFSNTWTVPHRRDGASTNRSRDP
jgi:hypothetical protein